DDLMRSFGSERLIGIFNSLGVPEGEQITHKMLSDTIEKAQKKIESNNFAIRKNLLEYDRVNNEQREMVYAQRRRVLMGENMKSQIQDMIRNVVENSVNSVLNGVPKNEWDLHELNQVLLPIVPLAKLSAERVADVSDVNALIEKLQDEALKLYDAKEAEFPEAEQFREVERVILLRVIDRKWMEEIDDMDQLRQNIGLQAYAQRNPVDEYKMASYDMMDAMNDAIQTETVTIMYRIRIEKKVEREEVAKVTGTNKDETASSGPKTRKAPKVYPNDPCPCGSGKKYKNCCGAK
ncbi:MAG: SEC-C domain-containing protein, partial [Lachnospiraceae bacterium]|nr:SEC-C domain-containing protein [Lachnospiraceae bacterium]